MSTEHISWMTTLHGNKRIVSDRLHHDVINKLTIEPGTQAKFNVSNQGDVKVGEIDLSKNSTLRIAVAKGGSMEVAHLLHMDAPHAFV